MNACEKGRRWELALNLLDQMRFKSNSPGAIHFGCILTANRLVLQWMSSLELLKEAALDVVCLTQALYAMDDAQQAIRKELLRKLLKETSRQIDLGIRGAHRAYSSATGSIEYVHDCLGDLGSFPLLRARVRSAASSEEALGSLCDLGRPCTLDALEDFHFASQKSLDFKSDFLSDFLAPNSRLLGGLVPQQAAASKLAVWTSVEISGDVPRLEVTFGRQRGQDLSGLASFHGL